MPAPPFSGRGASYADEASPTVRVRGESGFGSRAGAAERTTPRRWQSIEIGFEEWGRGALVLVGMPGPVPRAARQPSAADGTPTGDRISATPDPAIGDDRSESAAASGGARDEAETVALALETIALRVRVGEFRVRGLVPGMTDAAILAATLASILAPRR